MTGQRPLFARPPVKWAGGKTALLHEILPRLPVKIKNYYEPFVGGGAVFFAIAAENRFKSAWLGDTNEELIRTYAAIAKNVDEVIARLSVREYEEREYYAMRSLDPKKLTPVDRAARFIYLNRTCFNGLYRVNKKGQFNVPFGRYTNPTICDADGLRSVAPVLRKSHLSISDFEEQTSSAISGDAIYFDPPYVPVSPTANFTAYAKGGFDQNAHERLRNCFAEIDKRGVHVLLSNSDTPLVRKLYKGFKIERVEAPRRINSKGGKRGNVGELLISGKNK